MVTVDLPYESLFGVSYGLLAGFAPALAVGLVAVASGIVVDRSLPLPVGLATIPVAVGTGVAAGVFEPSTALSDGYRLGMASIVAGALGVVATSQGNRIATELPRDRAVPIVRGRPLAADAIDDIDAMGQVTIRSTGSIREFEGYPSPSPGLRTALATDAWRFPADLRLSELERRLERRLRTDYGLSKVAVAVDGRGRASIAAAPPVKGVARTLPDGTRAVTVAGLLPTGIEPGDRVAISVGDDDADDPIEGEVRAIGDADPAGADDLAGDAAAADDSPALSPSSNRHRADTGFDGGRGRLTVIVETGDAGRLLEADRYRIAVLPSGGANARAVEAAALLAEAGQPITALEGLEDGDTGIDIDAAELLGVRRDGSWEFVGGSADAGDAEAAGINADADTDTDDAAVLEGADRAFLAGTAQNRTGREVSDR